MPKPSFWQGQSVLITGNTGFKGSWLVAYLSQLGAKISGYSLPPPTQPSMFEICELHKLTQQTQADVRHLADFEAVLKKTKPSVVFHMAAQPLVRYSYREPIETFETNVMGTAIVLEAIRRYPTPRSVVVVTSDKCYQNLGPTKNGFVETDAMGGQDPYSASKGAAEIVVNSYAKSFFANTDVHVGSGRAGNVLGGGDWSEDRLVPDIVRAWTRKTPLEIRMPGAVRPWQHVLEPLRGYVMLAEKLAGSDGQIYAEGWNFGPAHADERPVRDVVDRLQELCKTLEVKYPTTPQPHEAAYLTLDSAKAKKQLGWQARWSFDQTMQYTFDWYEAHRQGQNMLKYTYQQLEQFGAS